MLEIIQGEGGIHLADPDYYQWRTRTVRCPRLADDLRRSPVRHGAYRQVVRLSAGGCPAGYRHPGQGPGFRRADRRLHGRRARLPACSSPGNHGSTFGGNPLACDGGPDDHRCHGRGRACWPTPPQIGALIRQLFGEALAGVKGVVDIRGHGLMIGIELDRPCGALVAQGAGGGPADQRDRRYAWFASCRRSPSASAMHASWWSVLAAADQGLPGWLKTHGRSRHFLQFKDFTRDEFDYCFRPHALDQGTSSSPTRSTGRLSDRTLVMIFEKASTRTRLSFEAGMQQLGGSAIYLNTRDSQLGRGEPVEDAAQVISRMSDIVMIRTFEQEIIERFAAQFARAGDQRPDQRIPPVPDPGRHLHLHRASRLASRARPWPGWAMPTICATPGCRRPKYWTSRCMCPRRRATRLNPELAGVLGTGHFTGVCRPDGCLSGRRSGHHRRVDLDGLRGRKRGADARLSPTGGSMAT